jgi:palmitoyl-protein thioesterase
MSQIEYVAEELAGVEELEGGYDAIGFSQGGQFLRCASFRIGTKKGGKAVG